MRKNLQLLLGMTGVTIVVISVLHIILGPSVIPGSIPVNATMDSEDRFFASIFLAYGVALLWCIKDVENKARVVYFLMLAFFIGGLARLISIAAVGLPHNFFIAMTVLELLLPLAIGTLQFKVSAKTPVQA